MDVLDELVRQLARLDEAQEGQARIDAGRDDARADLVAVLQDDAVRLVAADEDSLDLRLRADLDTGGARRAGDRIRDRSGAAARQSPGAERAVDLAHVVMEQHVRRAGRPDAEKRPDDARRRHRRLEHVGLEPLIEKVDRAHRHELDLVVLIAARQAPEALEQEEAAA